MKSTSRIRWRTMVCLAAGVTSACGYQPQSAAMHFDLSASTVEELEGDPAAQEKILGALEMLFGTPQNPGYMQLEAWADDDFNPNWPSYPADEDGSGEFSDDQLDAMAAENALRFAQELTAIADGRFEHVGPQMAAPALDRAWQGLLADYRDELLTEEELEEEGQLLFEEYYPSLADSAELYRQQCLHCHGVEGGGDGPTAGTREHPFLDPMPRDYRKGIFKYTAVKDKARPRREDLYTILDQGLYGTAMPSFRRFTRTQREGLGDYVRLLAIRGEVEQLLTLSVVEDEPLTPTLIGQTFADVWDKWQEADGKYIAFDGEIPEPTPERIARGQELYMDAETGNCFSCHGDSGLGDGVAAWKVDDDGNTVSAYEDDWGNAIEPRNLRYETYRFGRRPIDIYRRIYAGINGGPMPAIGESRGADGELLLSSDDLWAIVHYVRSLSEHPEEYVVFAPRAGASDDPHGDGEHGGDGDDSDTSHDSTPTGAGH